MKGVLDSIELRMLGRADYLPTRFPAHYEILTAFRSCKLVALQRCYALSYSLLSLAFTTRWNPKHPSYVSTRLFYNSTSFHLSYFPEPFILQVKPFINSFQSYFFCYKCWLRYFCHRVIDILYNLNKYM